MSCLRDIILEVRLSVIADLFLAARLLQADVEPALTDAWSVKLLLVYQIQCTFLLYCTCLVPDSPRRAGRLNSLLILMLDIFNTLSPLLQLIQIEVTLLIREILLLHSLTHNLFILVIHSKIWHIRVVVGPLVALQGQLFLGLNFDLLLFDLRYHN